MEQGDNLPLAQIEVVLQIRRGFGDVGVELHEGLRRQQIEVLGGDEIVVHVEHLTQIFGVFQVPLVHERKTLADVVLVVDVTHGSGVVIFVAEFIISGNGAKTAQAFQELFAVGTLFDFKALVLVDVVGNNFNPGDFVVVDKELQREALTPGTGRFGVDGRAKHTR